MDSSLGVAGGVGKSKALRMTCSGGNARGDIINPGALAGFDGLRDHMTQPEGGDSAEREGTDKVLPITG